MIEGKISVEYMTHMGDDLFVANVARVSFAKESKEFTTREDRPKGSDEGIIEYLAKAGHFTPFTHPQITLRCSAPVPIRTQCFKSKIGFVENEESRRYIKTEPEIYVPEFWRSAPEGSIKQGSAGVHPLTDKASFFYKETCAKALELYLWMIEEGIAPEQARFCLPQGAMVNWIWTGSLQAYARFYGLRIDSHAQKEVQDIAIAIDKIIEPLFPYSWAALTQRHKDN